jgi:hypothetical protein
LASGEVTVRYDENVTSAPRLKAAVINTAFGVGVVSVTNARSAPGLLRVTFDLECDGEQTRAVIRRRVGGV